MDIKKLTFQRLVYPCTATRGNRLSSADKTALIFPNSLDDTHIVLIAFMTENEYELKGSIKPPIDKRTFQDEYLYA